MVNDKGKTPDEYEDGVCKDETPDEDEDGVVEARAVDVAEVHAAEVSEAGTADITEVEKLHLFPLLGLLGLRVTSSPKSIWIVDLRPSHPMFSPSAAYLLCVAIGAGVGAIGSFLGEIDNEEICRGP